MKVPRMSQPHPASAYTARYNPVLPENYIPTGPKKFSSDFQRDDLQTVKSTKNSGYKVKDEKEESRLVLLAAGSQETCVTLFLGYWHFTL
jgi:hypothetical protein